MDILLWIDDERPMPEVFTHWAKTSQEAIDILENLSPEDVLVWISFDHDLGYDDEGVDDNSRRVAIWMSEHNVWPEFVHIHSLNPIGASWLYNHCVYDGPSDMRVVKIPYDSRIYR